MNSPDYQIMDNGDAAITVIFKEEISENLSRSIIQLSKVIKKELADKVVEIIPAYQSLTISYNPIVGMESEINKTLIKLLQTDWTPLNYQSKIIEIPVCYEDGFSPDLPTLAHHCRISEEEVIQRHTQVTYMVHMIGFLPGFLYLGGLDQKLHCPRKATPTVKVVAGSVGIGGNQTGVYPVTSPGGWHVIGRTPTKLFVPLNKNPFIAEPLDKIRFVPIRNDEFDSLIREPP